MENLPQNRPKEEPLKEGSSDYALWDPKLKIDDRDIDTPDRWIPRHPNLIRLTGRHPFNSEPPLQQCVEAGYITPVSLHYVRNHGACLKLDWDTHRVEINGLVDQPISLSMDELVNNFTPVTRTVTLVCCGNRRKEVNIVKKSMGFSWGATAISTNDWTGVRLSDVLKAAGVKDQKSGAKYVCFRGPKGELPKGEDGSYGTSMLLSYAMSEANDVMLAYKQNGRFLHPDHGFPVRIIIPGWIGGRMIKWLSELTVTSEESTNFYHYHDNKMLPPQIDEERAAKEGWWYKPEYILYDLNINSAISSPAHDERIYVDQNRKVPIKGYAYSGGGRQITRVEISFDNGKIWHLADLDIKEEPNEHGKYWAWVFFTFEATTFQLLTADEIICRAYDYGQNTQPATLTWTLLGQGNNAYFRLRIHREVDEHGRLCLRFQEPAPMLPGKLNNKGWMDDELASGKLDIYSPGGKEPVAPPVAASAAPLPGKHFTMAEIEKHDNEESAWFVHEGKVYDGTPYLEDHPGGAESIIINAGIDCTEEFNAIHSKTAHQLLAKHYIGDLVTDKPIEAVKAADAVPAKTELIALNPKKKQAFALKEKVVLSHNVRLFRFALQSPEHKLGLPVGKHMFLYAKVNGETVMRAYTPSSSDDDLGVFDLVVKVYWKNEHPKFPEGGKMSQHLESMNIGDTIEVKGPLGEFIYTAPGVYDHGKRKNQKVKKMSMIAGGTGLTPMYQVIKAILKNKEDNVQIKLLYANQSEDDILLWDELDQMAADHDNFDVWYTVDRPPAEWKYSTGFINEEMLKKTLFEPEEGTICLMCGPPPMLKFACYPNLEKVGYSPEQMITF